MFKHNGFRFAVQNLKSHTKTRLNHIKNHNKITSDFTLKEWETTPFYNVKIT